MSSPAGRSLLVTRGSVPSLLAATVALAVMLVGVVARLPAHVTVTLPLEVAAAVAVTAAAYAALVALASRLRSASLAVPALLAGAALLPRLFAAIHPAVPSLRAATPAFCGPLPALCPSPSWNALTGLTFGLLLLPFLLAAVHVRASDAHDDQARAAWLSGALMIAVAGVLVALGCLSPSAVPLACAAGLAFMAAATIDSRRRHATLAAWLRDGSAQVRRPATDDPGDLRPFCAPSPGVALDGVLTLVTRSTAGAYRSGALAQAAARVPLDPLATLEALDERARLQRSGLAVVAVAAATIAGCSALLNR